VTLVVDVSPEASAEIINADYSTYSDEVLPVQGQPVSTEIIPFDLLVSKQAPAVTAPGSVLTYTLSVSNPHPFAALSGVVLTDSPPTDTEVISASTPYTLSDGLITWTLPSLEAGEIWTRELVVQILPSADLTILNEHYAASSIEVPTPVIGAPVFTTVGYLYILPVIFNAK